MGEKRNAYRILVGKPEGKGPLGRPTRRWADNIEMDLRDIGWDGVEWIRWIWHVYGYVCGCAVCAVCLPVRVSSWEVLEGLHNWRLLKKGSAP
jgi:hypothetical protein